MSRMISFRHRLFPTKTRRRAKATRVTSWQPVAESLEDRTMMTASAYVDPAGVLQVEGTSGNDVISVHRSYGVVTTQSSLGLDSRWDSPITSFRREWVYSVSIQQGTANYEPTALLYLANFPVSSVRSLEIDAQAGHDLVTNATTLPSIIYGQSGNDKLVGGSSSDRLYGSWGNDILIGNAGNDQLYGYYGNDSLRGNAGADHLDGSYGNDLLDGGSQADTLIGGWGDDNLDGGSGDDTLDGGWGQDRLFGDSGNDILRGGNQADTLLGGLGNDQLYGGEGADLLDGGWDHDSMWGEDGDDTLRGGSGNDTIYGGSGDDDIYGGSGNDRLYGQSGNDGLFGGEGQDYLSGGYNADRFLVIRDEFMTGSGEDTIASLSSSDVRINFVNGSSTSASLGSNFGQVTVDAAFWADSEIEMIDEGFRTLADLTGNTKLLKLSNGDEMSFIRQGKIWRPDGTEHTSVGGWNSSSTGAITLIDNTFTEIPGIDEDVRERVLRLVYHEIGHNWDEQDENEFVDEFRSVSNWRFEIVNGNFDANTMKMATDNNWANWWFDPRTEFARTYGQMNPKEDFATSFAAYLMSSMGEDYRGESGANVDARMRSDGPGKFDVLDDFFASLA